MIVFVKLAAAVLVAPFSTEIKVYILNTAEVVREYAHQLYIVALYGCNYIAGFHHAGTEEDDTQATAHALHFLACLFCPRSAALGGLLVLV